MSNQQQPAISYRNSIWLFSFLLLILFAVFSVGAGLNVLRMGHEWRRRELHHFITTSNSIQKLMLTSDVGSKILAGGNSDYLQYTQEMLITFFIMVLGNTT